MKKSIWTITLLSLTALCGFSGGKCRANASSVAHDGEKYQIIRNKEDGKRYLIDNKKKTVSGWHMRIGKKYYRLGKINDVGFYKTKQVKLIFTKKSGKFAKNECIRTIDFDSSGLTTTTKGMKKIGHNYYFISHGYLQTSDITYKGVKYYINLNGTVACYRTKGVVYSPSGKKLTKPQRKEVLARSHARTIIRECTNKSMTQSKKMDKCFMWVVKNYSYTERRCKGQKGWSSISADALYRFQSGDCRTLSTGFAFLASELGYRKVKIAQDCGGRFSGTHVWALVNNRCYDPLFYNTAKPKRYLPVFKGSTPAAYAAKTHCHASQTFKPGD